MRKSLALAGTAMAAALLSAAGISTAGTAHAATAKLSPTLSMSVQHFAVTAGADDTITGSLRYEYSFPQGSVGLYSVHRGRLTLLQTKVQPGLGAHGTGSDKVNFTVTPTTTTTYELIFKGNATYLPAHSSAMTVMVLPKRGAKATSLSISVANPDIKLGATDTFTGELKSGTSPLSHAPVGLYAWNGSRLTRIQTRLTSGSGQADFTIRPGGSVTESTQHRYELIYAGAAAYSPSYSPLATITVLGKTHTSLSVSVAHSAISAGATDTVTGRLANLSQFNDFVGNAPVGLYAVHGSRLTLIQTRTTQSDGYVNFTVAPTATTTYELTYRGNATYLPSRSATATITVTPSATASPAPTA